MVGLPMSNRTVGGVLRRSRWVETVVPAVMPPPLVASERSRPAQKARPVPVRTTTRTSGSRSASTRRWVSWFSIGPEMVFIRSGRLSVMVAMCSLTSQRTSAAGCASLAAVFTAVVMAGRPVSDGDRTGSARQAGRLSMITEGKPASGRRGRRLRRRLADGRLDQFDDVAVGILGQADDGAAHGFDRRRLTGDLQAVGADGLDQPHRIGDVEHELHGIVPVVWR